MMWQYAPFISFLASLVILWGLVSRKLAGIALDKPNARSLHVTPVPRTGGLGILAGIAAGWLVVFEAAAFSMLWIPLLLLAAVSFLDDRYGIQIGWRFVAHLIGMGGLLMATWPHGLSWLFFPPVLLLLVWVINLYNFMDGSDGLAGGMALFGFGFYGVAAWMVGDNFLAGLSWSIAAAAGAFLIFNFHPARIFMGDAGSVPLGFLAGAIGWLGWQKGDWPAWFGAVLFSPFIVDATVTLVRRFLRGEKVWQAHREHYYQRMVRMGLGHRRTALYEYLLMMFVGTSALAAIGFDMKVWLALFAILAAIYGVLMITVDRNWQKFAGQNPDA